MLLENKTAVIYGAGGAIGGAVARAFAREGASVFLAGRTRASLERVASGITGTAHPARVVPVDAADATAVERHVASIVAQAGKLDISFNVVGLGDAQGSPLLEMQHEHFARPIATAMLTHFLTTTAAVRHMSKLGSGVLLTVTAQASRKPYPDTGGFGVACAALEALYRQLAAEAGPRGVRVACLRSAGSPDAPGVDAVFRQHAKNAGTTRQAFEASIAERTLLKRLPTLDEVANVATLLASDRASAVTAAIANVTCGELTD